MKILVKLKKHYILSSILLAGILIFGGKKFFKPQAINVLTQPLQKGSIMECVYGVGTVFSNKSFQVKSGIPSKIHEVFVNEGDFVEQGTPLIKLETLFCAPFTGTIISTSGAVGETAFPQTILVTLTDLTDRYIQVTLDQTGALQVQKGQRVTLSFDGLRDETFVGAVTAVYPKEGHFLVHIDVKTLPPQILPGMSSDLAIEISEHQDIFVVPLTALINNQVYVKRGIEKPIPITVAVGLINGSIAEVFSEELLEGDLIVQSKGHP
ncbi:MAG: efflux RND transporter periplasmic adaptor subunit [Simkaniaceae bacterium]|nr:MAG: efflux RND transporter periplasmic adaptor subunit [Simkaniaceae bacterium]